jgi:hypothetical protein
VPDGGSAEPDAGDAGPAPLDGGTPDSGPSPVDAGGCTRDSACSTGQICESGTCSACTGYQCAPAASADLFELTGSVTVVGTTVTVQLLAPYISVAEGTPPAHDYDDRVGGFGCYADHYVTGSKPPPPDANAGPIEITGYSGGQFDGFGAGSAPNKIYCAVENGNYSCGYGPLSSSGQPGKTVEGEVYASGTDPMGPGPITFSDATNSVLGTFSLSASPVGTVSASGLGSETYTASQDVTLSYSCSTACTSDLILVTLAATQNTGTNLTAASSSFGAVSCAQLGGSSITVPKAAIAAMLDNDSSLKSVVTSIVLAQPEGGQDSSGHRIAILVGRGAFGVSSL